MSYPKLLPEIKSQWMADLRSGDYSQGKFLLKQIGRKTQKPLHCCMGVLAEKQGLEERLSDEEGANPIIDFNFGFSNWQNSALEPEWFIELFDYDPQEYSDILQKIDKLIEKIASLNDGTNYEYRAYTFPEIADWINDNL